MTIFDQLLPLRLCRSCLEPVTRTSPNQQKNIQKKSDDLCENCQHKHISYGPTCSRCALPMCLYNQERPIELICAECLKEPPAFTQVICPFIYHAPVSHWLHRFKYQGNVSDGKLLVRVLCASIEASPTPFPNYLVSVPMHWSKRLSRGFNQTDWLTRQLSQNFKIPIINVLQRNAGYTTQSHSNRRTRKNIKGAYQLRPTMIRTIKQQHLALVDDVVTTGATSRFISQLLIDAGAEKIDIWCLARTAKEHGK